jgi:membrane fusion protein (multidrug efflux system)
MAVDGMKWLVRLLASTTMLCATAAINAQNLSGGQDLVRVLVTPQVETTLVSEIAARITELRVSLGSSFTKGDLLVQFDCAEQMAQLAMTEAELDAALHTEDAKKQLRELGQAGELEVALATSAVNRTRAQIDLHRTQLSRCRIDAPFNGRTAKINVHAHQGVAAGTELLEIVSDSKPKLRLNVPAQWVNWLKPGSMFEVSIEETGKIYRASVSAINSRVDAISLSLELEGTLETDAADLLPGMSGVARFAQPGR